MNKRWSVLLLPAIIVAADAGSRYIDRYRSPCVRHDTHGALSRILIDRKVAYDLTMGSVEELGRVADRFSCSATFNFVRPSDRSNGSLAGVRFTVLQPDDTANGVEIPDDQMARIAAEP